jgi:hypothetical protein
MSEFTHPTGGEPVASRIDPFPSTPSCAVPCHVNAFPQHTAMIVTGAAYDDLRERDERTCNPEEEVW